MPRKKGGRSGTPDGYSPSPLGEEPRGRSRSPRVGDSPRDSPRGGRSPTREAVPAPRLAPVPSWRGLRACLPRGSEPRAGELEAEPVATGFGAHAHVLLSPRMMTNAGLGPGDWVALAIRGDTSGGGESATDGCAADDDADAPSAALCSALLARNLPILVTCENARAHENETGSADERARLGRYVVLARAHPHAKASSPNAVALARKTWMSLGRPAGHARIWVCPLDVARAIGAVTETKETAPAERTDAKALLTETRAFPLAAPSPGAACASAALTLWALEGGAAPGSAGDWLERGLRAGAVQAGASTDASKGSNKQLAVLESLARRALDGRCLLPGNLVRLPLLGASAFFVVENARGFGPVGAATTVALRGEREAARGAGLGPGDVRGPPDASFAVSSVTNDDSSDVSEKGDPAVTAAARARRAGERFASAADAAGGYASLGGVDALVASLRESVELPLARPELFERRGVRPPRGVLLWGPPGTGKTRLARAAAASANAALLVVRGPELVTAAVGESEAALRGVFAAAAAAAPCVVLLDELDAIAPARAGGDGLGGRGDAGASGGGDEQMSARVVAALLSALDGAGGEKDENDMRGVVVVATTNRPEAVDRALRRPGRFDREIEVGVPTPSARREILQKHMRALRHSVTEAQADALARDAHGFVGADVAALCAGAAMQALRRVVGREDQTLVAEDLASKLGSSLRLARRDDDSLTKDSSRERHRRDATPTTRAPSERGATEPRDFGDDADRVTFADFLAARRRVKPSALREVAVEAPRVAWDDVGGHAAIKQQLREAVEWQERHGDALRRVGAVPPAGTLLYGPPGCSKTMLARAVASASGRNFVTVTGPELHSKYVGESEKAVRALFARAAASAPSVIFLDELDGLVGRRSSHSVGGGPSASDRVLTQLLGEMDGLASDSKNVCVVAATNRPDLVDPALLRPGRFDRALYVPPPTDWEDRAAILRRAARKTPLAPDVDLKMLAMGTAGYTGADLQAYVREAAVCALEEDLESSQVCARHFAAAAARVPPSPPVSAETAAAYASFERAGYASRTG